MNLCVLYLSGYVGGEYFQNPGGGSNYLCLHMHPTWLNYTETVEPQYPSGRSMSGTNYNLPTWFSSDKDFNLYFAPCAVCRIKSRGSVMMIPGRSLCPDDWHQEYFGYLMKEKTTRKRTEYVCVDKDAEKGPFGPRDNKPDSSKKFASFSMTRVFCGYGIPCKEPHGYVKQRELTCTVCTK